MHVRVDERRREHETGRIDDPMAVRVEVGADLRDHAVVDADVERRVDSLRRIEDARAADHDVVCAGAADEHHATPTAVSTATGPLVSKS